MNMINKNDTELCREKAAEYLGVTSNTLKSYPIPFRQYRRFGCALYKKSALDKFKAEHTFVPGTEKSAA